MLGMTLSWFCLIRAAVCVDILPWSLAKTSHSAINVSAYMLRERYPQNQQLWFHVKLFLRMNVVAMDLASATQ
jgi:hypothetical protein